MNKLSKIAGAAAAATLVAISGSAFTNTNTVNASAAGAGSTLISTYTTSDIQYNPDSANPENLDSVKFTLDKTARYVALRTKSGGSWYRSDDGDPTAATPIPHKCTTADNKTWTCDVDNANEKVADAVSLSVVAAN